MLHRILVLVILLPIQVADAVLPFPFGEAANDTFTFYNDDGSSGVFPLPEPMPFLGDVVEQVYQNTNGDITFDSPYSDFTPEIIPSSSVPPMIAVFWSDVDTRNRLTNVTSGDNELWARTTTDTMDLQRADNLVLGARPGSQFRSDAAFIATWFNVAPYGFDTANRNTFQLAVAWNEFESWTFFSYDKLEWYQASTVSTIARA